MGVNLSTLILEISDERATEIIEKVSLYIVKRRMASAAIMVIESLRPLHNIGSQLMYFLAPFAEVIFNAKEYQELAALLEKEEHVKLLLKRLDELDTEYFKEERKNQGIKRKRFWNKIKRIFSKKK